MHRHGDVGQLILDSSELRRAAAATLGGEDLSVDEHLSTPHAPWLVALNRPFETLDDHRTGRTDRLGDGDVLELFREIDAGQRCIEVVACGVGPDGR